MPRNNTKKRRNSSAKKNKGRSTRTGDSERVQLGVVRQGPLPDSTDVIFIHPREKTITFTREVNLNTISSVAAAGTYGAISIALNQLPNYAKLAAVFDCFRILEFQARFIPVYNTINYTGPSTPITVPGELLTCLDYDDATAPTSTDQVRSYQNSMVSKVTQYHERTVVPCAANALYVGSVFTGYGRIKSPWIDCSITNIATSAAIPHYGIKYAIGPDGGLGVTIPLFHLSACVVFQFKNVVD